MNRAWSGNALVAAALVAAAPTDRDANTRLRPWCAGRAHERPVAAALVAAASPKRRRAVSGDAPRLPRAYYRTRVGIGGSRFINRRGDRFFSVLRHAIRPEET